MLRSLRNEMDFYFAESGQEALQILTEQEVNVLVSDMRMPGMEWRSSFNYSDGTISADHKDHAHWTC